MSKTYEALLRAEKEQTANSKGAMISKAAFEPRIKKRKRKTKRAKDPLRHDVRQERQGAYGFLEKAERGGAQGKERHLAKRRQGPPHSHRPLVRQLPEPEKGRGLQALAPAGCHPGIHRPIISSLYQQRFKMA